MRSHVTDTLRFLQFLGSWYIVQYYASSEEALAYRCMRAELSVSPESAEVTMNFTYSFTDDPINELLVGNITWKIPSPDLPAHWVHAEFPCKYINIYLTRISYQLSHRRRVIDDIIINSSKILYPE